MKTETRLQLERFAYGGKTLDEHYQAANQNDSFYFGLPGRIEKRQQDKIPIAGEGAVTFFSIASSVTRPFAKILPFPFLAIHGMLSFTEQVARERSGL
jgi:hypothetical protein